LAIWFEALRLAQHPHNGTNVRPLGTAA
jgi:hypothetical protein